MTIGNVTLALAFLAGLVSFLSPCVLPLVPAYLAYLGGRSAEVAPTPGRTLQVVNGAAFVLGLSLVFIVLFYAVRTLPPGIRAFSVPIAGVVVIVLGLQIAGLLRIPGLGRESRPLERYVPASGGSGGAFLLGVSLAFGWTPCIGPTLGAVLTSGANEGATAAGLALMLAYCLGLGAPFLVLGLTMDRAAAIATAVGRARPAIQLASGAVLLAIGALVLTDNLTLLDQLFARALPGALRVPFGL